MILNSRTFFAARRAVTGALVLSSTALVGCAEQADAANHRDAKVVAPAQKDALLNAVRTLLQSGQIVVTPVTDNTATVKVTDDDDAAAPQPPSGAPSGPSIVDVTRNPDPKADDPDVHTGKVVIDSSGNGTVITVPGFPQITLVPNEKTGEITVKGPGGIEFTVPAEDILIEAPGGLVVDN